MNITTIISQTKLDMLQERVCRPINYLTSKVDSATPLWDGPIKMCQQIENDVFSVDSVVKETRNIKGKFNDNSTYLYQSVLCLIYILLYYRHNDDTLYKEIVFPRLRDNMGIYNNQYLNKINDQINKILDQEKLLKKVQEEKNKDVKPVFKYVGHNRDEMDRLYIEYGEEKLFRSMSGAIKKLSEMFDTNQDEANVWFNAKRVVHALRDANRPELLIERAATSLSPGEIYNPYDSSQIILLCVYTMIRASKNNDHFDLFIEKMESLSDEEDTDLTVIKQCINAIKQRMDSNLPYDDFDYIGEQTIKGEAFTSADIERIRNQIVDQEKKEREKLQKIIEKLEPENVALKQQVSSLEEELKAEKSKKEIDSDDEDEEVEMLTELDSIPILKLLWYLMQKDGANVEGHGKKKPAQNILATLSKIPYNTTKHLWKKEEDPITKQEDLIVKMNLWMKAIDMDFQF